MVKRSRCKNTVVSSPWRMNTYLLRTVWLLYLSLSTSLGELTKQCTTDSGGPASGGRCGRNLSNMMDFVCMMHGGFFSGASAVVQKRTYTDVTPDVHTRNKRDLNLPLLSKQDAKTMFEKRLGGRAVTQGIVCECCTHQCSMREMVEYCNMGPPRSGRSSSGLRRQGRTPHQMAKKWISAPGGVKNDAVRKDARTSEDAARNLFSLFSFLASAIEKDQNENLIPTVHDSIPTEYDIVKEVLLSNTPKDYTNDFNLENFINYELDQATKRPHDSTFDDTNKDRHLLIYEPNNKSNNSKPSEINVTGHTNLNNILSQNRNRIVGTNKENGKNSRPEQNAEMRAGWLQTKLGHIESLDKVTDWLRALGAPGFNGNEKHKTANSRIEDTGGQ